MNSKLWKSFRNTTEAVKEVFVSSIVQNGGRDRYRWLFSLTQLIQFFFSFNVVLTSLGTVRVVDVSWNFGSARWW
jgi:hypothetical protein